MPSHLTQGPAHGPARRGRRKRAHRGIAAAVAAGLAFVAVAALPLTPAWRGNRMGKPAAAVQGRPPAALVALKLPAIAQPLADLPTTAPTPSTPADDQRQVQLVRSEDRRLQQLLHASFHLHVPTLLAQAGHLATLVLPKRPQPYGLNDLITAGAVVRQGGGVAQLNSSVFVAPDAVLLLNDPSVQTLRVSSSAKGFASLVGWNSSITIAGASPTQPLHIVGWDVLADRPDSVEADGRAYIRALGGRLMVSNIRTHALGFWSGRTGGVAWTGISKHTTTGGATDSQFTGSLYGAYVSRSDKVTFTRDLFQGNDRDGLHLHRSAIGTMVQQSAVAGNGGSGLNIDRGASVTAVDGLLAQGNLRSGVVVNGRPVVNGPSASGAEAIPAGDTVIRHADVIGNRATGILVEGGIGVTLDQDRVCGPATGISIRAGAVAARVINSEVNCAGAIALSIGPGVTGTAVSGTTLSGAHIGLLVRNSSLIRLDNNLIQRASVFGISVRGFSPQITGSGNVVRGHGARPLDVLGTQTRPRLVATDVTGWSRSSHVGPLGYLRYHPLFTIWLAILSLIVGGSVVQRIRRLPSHPYEQSSRWLTTKAPRRSVVASPVDPMAVDFRYEISTAPSWHELRVLTAVRAEGDVSIHPQRRRVLDMTGPDIELYESELMDGAVD